MFILAVLQTAAIPLPDLVTEARSGNLPSFSEVLDARFGPAGGARLAAFKVWASNLDAAEKARTLATLPSGPDGKPRTTVAAACSYPDMRGTARAMVVATDSPDRATAQRMWSESDRVEALARTLERERLAKARTETRPTAAGGALAIRVASDQAWREAMFDREHDDKTAEVLFWRLSSRLCHIDQENTQFLKTMIARDGWPTISRDGKDAASDAWLLAQHADADPEFQAKVLELMRPLVARNEASGENYALLFDRVALAQHRPQRYGTQFGDGGGCLAVMSVEDHAGLDARRKAVGLGTLAENGKRLRDSYHQPICADIFAATKD